MTRTRCLRGCGRRGFIRARSSIGVRCRFFTLFRFIRAGLSTMIEAGTVESSTAIPKAAFVDRHGLTWSTGAMPALRVDGCAEFGRSRHFRYAAEALRLEAVALPFVPEAILPASVMGEGGTLAWQSQLRLKL